MMKLMSMILFVSLIVIGVAIAQEGDVPSERVASDAVQKYEQSSPRDIVSSKSPVVADDVHFPKRPVKKVLQTTLQTSDKLVLEPIGKVKDATNDALDGKMELVGSEESSDDSVTAPKFKVTF